MLSWSFEFEDKDYFEGFRSLATNGVDKPVLNVFRMFALMSGNRVEHHQHRAGRRSTRSSAPACGRRLTSTRSPPGQIARPRSCVWNYHDVDGPAGAAAPS